MLKLFEEIRQDLFKDIKNGLPDADITSDSDYFIRASSIASVLSDIYRLHGWIVRQIFPDTADTEYLELHCRTRGLRRKQATTASGDITFTGEPGTELPAGLEAKRDNLSWITAQSGIIDENGKAVIHAKSAQAGVNGNSQQTQSAQLASTPAGIDSTVIVGVMTGGTAQETDTELLARLLDLIRRPPAGGNKHDYKRWALEVDGVTSAIVYPLRRGLGTVDIVITSGEHLPSPEIVQATQDHIDLVRPVTASNSRVFVPHLLRVNFIVKVKLDGISLADAQKLIEAALKEHINRMQPGEPLVISQIEAIISNIDGIADRVLIAPDANISAEVSELVTGWIRFEGLVVSELEA
jgi:uncharacterized phage protein gp47/JayE